MDISEIFIKDCSKNLIKNGGMEDGNPPTGFIQGWDNPPVTWERSGIQKYSGNYSAHAKGCGFYHSGPRSTFIKDRSYKISFQYYLISGMLDLIIYDGDGSTPLFNINYTAPIGAWTKVEKIVVSVNPGSLATTLFLISVGEVYIDEDSVCEV